MGIAKTTDLIHRGRFQILYRGPRSKEKNRETRPVPVAKAKRALEKKCDPIMGESVPWVTISNPRPRKRVLYLIRGALRPSPPISFESAGLVSEGRVRARDQTRSWAMGNFASIHVRSVRHEIGPPMIDHIQML